MTELTTSASPDARPLSQQELLAALHAKFEANFKRSALSQDKATAAASKARTLWQAGRLLQGKATYRHQEELTGYLDEIFGDATCALYLTSCGLTVPARMLVRRSLELGMVIVSYWDSPVDFWQWREHDGDIHFSALCSHLQSEGYRTFLNRDANATSLDIAPVVTDLQKLYSDLSNVVHPKPYNFATGTKAAYEFDEAQFQKSLVMAEAVYEQLFKLLQARFSI